jgi:hypothetical protein
MALEVMALEVLSANDSRRRRRAESSMSRIPLMSTLEAAWMPCVPSTKPTILVWESRKSAL